jgi:hypothetical protein
MQPIPVESIGIPAVNLEGKLSEIVGARMGEVERLS